LQCGNNVAVLKLEQNGAYVDLESDLLVADVDSLPHHVRIGHPFGWSVRHGTGKAWSIEDHAPDTGNFAEFIQQVFCRLGIEQPLS
jgi:hypothetical protein